MRSVWLLMIGVAPLSASAAALEAEVSPAFAWSYVSEATAPALRARLGADFPWFTPSIVGFGAATSTPRGPSHDQDGGLQLWGVAVEARLHTPGPNQWIAGIGAGWGKLGLDQKPQGDYSTSRGPAAPHVEVTLVISVAASIGLRLAEL